MTFEQLLEEVYLITDRRDLVNQTKSAIKAATLKAHQSDYFSKDIFEEGFQWDELGYRQQLDYYSLIPNFRALKYVRRVQDQHDDAGTFFEVVTPEEVLDSYGQGRLDIAYVAGRVLELRASCTFKYVLLGAYVLPIVREDAFSSWIAELQPFAIIYEACRVIFKSIGYDEQSATFTGLVAEEYVMLKMTGLADVGY